MAETLINTNQIDGSIGGAKALNAAVVGNPTISDDFILSGCSENDYLVYPQMSPMTYPSQIINPSSTSFKVKVKFRMTTIADCPMVVQSHDEQNFQLRVDSLHQLCFIVSANGGWLNSGEFETGVEYTTANEWWWLEAGLDDDRYLYINKSLDGETYTNIWKSNGTYACGGWSRLEFIGWNSPTLEFDLKEYKFYIGGILVYTAVKDAE